MGRFGASLHDERRLPRPTPTAIGRARTPDLSIGRPLQCVVTARTPNY